MDELTLDHAIAVTTKVLEAAEKTSATVAVVVVDATANPVVSVRPPGVAALVESAARRKAAAAAFGAPTDTLAEMFGGDPLLAGVFAGSPDVLVLPGGFPLAGANGICGAVGIAGGHYSADQAIGEDALGDLRATT
ncbi:heme-binding protein [Mycolicibacterium pulveris]|uniref:Heme-binding protein n=1 Tax=Mycolicibacterium pulveris TaxID=36813 RepID=A0A7I7UQS0_MYCPV|nr:heme-binding protein [Mycolicibacterium pulveris]MCV6983288.1 heme-binding protein [Mycolicibacterium pulveris]BBY83163.1 hypothetical protein MPUL_43210 [Mycolicibacterium pulveris]